MEDKKAPKKKAAVTAVLLMYILFAAVFALYVLPKSSLWLTLKEPTADMVEIHEIGGLSGQENYIRLHKDNTGYYMTVTSGQNDDAPDVYRLTKEEYILCTDIDLEYLEEVPEDTKSDGYSYAVTIKEKGKPEKSVPFRYTDAYRLGWMRFIQDSKQCSSDETISFDRYITLAGYLDERGEENGFFKHDYDNGDSESIGMKFFYLRKTVTRGIPKELTEAVQANSLLLREQTKPGRIEKQREIFSESVKTDFYGKTAYLNSGSTDGYMYFTLACPESNDYFCFIGEKPKLIPQWLFLKDICDIITGSHTDIVIFAAVTAGLAVLCRRLLASGERKRVKKNETGKD